jgi:predicted nucleic acid-binding protein
MILTDAGPLIALIDRGEPDHARCVAALTQITMPLVTTWPAFTEAMYLLGEAGGWMGQQALWALVERADLQIAELSTAAVGRMRALMERYRDLPMDLADASLVALAEERDLDRVFTLDNDFRVYRLPRRRAFTIVP